MLSKTIACLLAFTVCVMALKAGEIVVALNEENLLENGDFSKGKRKWDGDFKIKEIGDNKMARMELDDDESVFLTQELKTKDIKDIALSFRYRLAEGTSGRGISTRFRRSDGSYTYRTLDLQATGEWIEVTWKFGEIRGAKKLIFIVEV